MFSYDQTWQFPTRGSSELTNAEYLIPQVESYLWVLSTETMGRGYSVQSPDGAARRIYQSFKRGAYLVDIGGRRTASGSFLIP